MLFDEVQKVMAERRQTGHKTESLCGGLVYCHCGAKMYAQTTKKKGHAYPKWRCSAKGCQEKYPYNGKEVKGIPLEVVETAARRYLRELLSPENQSMIADAVRAYQRDAKGSEKDFKESVRQEIESKQRSYDALAANLKTGVLPAEVVSALGEEMKQLLLDMEYLKTMPAPVDFTAQRIIEWLEGIKQAPDREAIHLLIERIDIRPVEDAMEIQIKSTLDALLELDEDEKRPTPADDSTGVGKTGCGGRI